MYPGQVRRRDDIIVHKLSLCEVSVGNERGDLLELYSWVGHQQGRPEWCELMYRVQRRSILDRLNRGGLHRLYIVALPAIERADELHRM